MIIEVDLLVVILFAVAFFLLLIHTIFGDLLGKALYKYLKHKIKERLEKED